MPTPQLTARLRGGGCGVLVGGLAVAAHGMAGGAVPRSADIALLLLVSLAAGMFAAGTAAQPPRSSRLPLGGPRAARVGHSRMPATARSALALLGGQWAGHYALSWSPGHHESADGFAHLPGAPMIAAHVLAAFACAALILVAERLYLAASSVVRALLRRPAALLAPRDTRWADARATVVVIRPKGARSPRAPPLFA
ncbi:hypothetical protein [Nocardia neocaledoniensis]|uniref:hypothetical protein n=1 Tax=Nocardia neocaledoniensis TaxID=236511 RepID=UPI002458F473|nr:hypothetical protein [Nocardia neocaledoniensis]